MNTTPVGFDAANAIIYLPGDTPGTFISFRFPADEESIRHEESIQLLRTVKRGKTHTERVGGIEADLMLARLIVQDGISVSRDQAIVIFSKILPKTVSVNVKNRSVEVIQSFIDGQVTAKHIMRMPGPDERHAADALTLMGFIVRDLGDGVSRILMNCKPLLALYDMVQESVAGYIGEPPALHKLAAVTDYVHQLNLKGNAA